MNNLRFGDERKYFKRTFEELVAREFSLRTGKKVRKDSRNLVIKTTEFGLETIERRVVSENSIVICKILMGKDTLFLNNNERENRLIKECKEFLKKNEIEGCYLALLVSLGKYIIKEIMVN